MLPVTLALVDDDTEYCEFLAQHLRAQGVEVQAYSDSSDLLADMAPYRFDFYVLDLMLPGVDGAELIRILRKRTQAGVLIVSGRLGPEVFAEVINARDREGRTVEANFVGLRELALVDADFDATTRSGEITVRFLGELTSVVRDKAGVIVEGSATEVKRQRDVWTFARRMGVQDPNWQLVATGD